MSILNKQQTDSFRRAFSATRRQEIKAKRFLHKLDLAQIKSHLPRCNFFQVNFTGITESRLQKGEKKKKRRSAPRRGRRGRIKEGESVRKGWPVSPEDCLLDELGWKRLEYVRVKQLAVTMHKIHNDPSPSYLRRIFTNTSNAHSESQKF